MTVSASTRWLIVLAGALAASACERASFESLGTRPDLEAKPQPAPHDASASDAGFDAAVNGAGGRGAAVATAGELAAGSGGANPPIAAAGSGGAATPRATEPDGGPDELTGSFPPETFDGVKAAFVIGRSQEFDTTTVYLFDHSVTCDEISMFSWLRQLPDDVQVIEIEFPSTAMVGGAVSGSVVNYALGGMYSLSRTTASARLLVLSRYESDGVVEGTLDATFSSGSVSGAFHADYCADGRAF